MDDLISRQAAIDALKNDMASLDHIIQGMSGYDVRLDAYVSQRNQVNCDIDTISNLPPAQPEPCEDTVSRKDCLKALSNMMDTDGFRNGWAVSRANVECMLKSMPPVTPKQHIDADGTLWVTVTDIGRVTRVIVDEEKSKFCRQFYMDAQPEQRTGRWIPQDHNKRAGNISTCVYYYPTCSECGKVGNDTYKYCPHCGAKMEGDAE